VTFSLVARDADGSFGAVIASSSPAVSARCLWLRDRVGAVATQNITDPRIGNRALDLLSTGIAADEALLRIESDDPTFAYRQVLAVDARGRASVRSGSAALGMVASAIGDGAVAAGNMLADLSVPQAMVKGWSQAEGEIEERLLAALRAGRDAGGEAGPIHSAGLAVVSSVGWRVTDLRVDWHEDDPVGELAALLSVWLPQRDDYVARGLNPGESAGYGVPGDARP
jgi:uncharacterized Ntn-hydrolase superfamily protein